MKLTAVTGAGSVTTTGVDTTEAVSQDAAFSDVLQGEVKKTTKLDAIFQKAADTYGVDVELLKAMAKAESGFDPNATSKAGAMGVMQLMPATAKSLGVTDAYDPEQNIMGGAKYIASLLEQYDGNVSYALAAYNAGSGNVAKYGGIPPFEETQNYVAKILGYLQDGGVEIPQEWSVVESDAQTDASQTTLPDVLKQLFTQEDYEDFLRLFLERLTQRLQEKAEQTTDTQASAAQEESVSDAYVAYRNFGNTNRMAIYLKPSE